MTQADHEAQDAAFRLWDRLNQTRANNGGTLTKAEWLSTVALQISAELSAYVKRPRFKNGRNPLFDALAVGCGERLAELTRSGARAVGVALADIRAVSPELTPEEIGVRIAKFKQKHPDWPLTAPTIAKYWSSLGSGDSTRTAKLDIYQEPAEWLSACIQLWGDDVGRQVHAKGWAEIRVGYGRDILSQLAKKI